MCRRRADCYALFHCGKRRGVKLKNKDEGDEVKEGVGKEYSPHNKTTKNDGHKGPCCALCSHLLQKMWNCLEKKKILLEKEEADVAQLTKKNPPKQEVGHQCNCEKTLFIQHRTLMFP